MSKRPVIDLLFEAIVNGDTQQFDTIAETRAQECVEIRSLVCTSDPKAIDLDMGLGLQPCEYVTPIFEGPRAWLLSRHTAIQSRLESGRSNVLVDYSLGFDSNFAEKLRALINGEKIQQVDRDRVTAVLKLKASNQNVQFDIVPFLNENTRLVRDDPKNRRPLNTLVAFYMLDHLDWEAFLADQTRFKFDASIEDIRMRLEIKAAEFLASQYSNEEVLKQEAIAMGTQALLLRFATLWKAHRGNRKQVLRDLLDFCLFELGFLPISELTLIWRGTHEKQVVPFFGPLINPSSKTLKSVRGMAWDITHLRSLQDTARKSVFGSFFIPYFVSLDERWRNLLRINPIKVMLIDDATRSVNYGRSRDVEFQLLIAEVLSDRAKVEMNPEKVEKRRIAARSLDRHAMERLVEHERQAWA
jgi:hypothetical protein